MCTLRCRNMLYCNIYKDFCFRLCSASAVSANPILLGLSWIVMQKWKSVNPSVVNVFRLEATRSHFCRYFGVRVFYIKPICELYFVMWLVHHQ